MDNSKTDNKKLTKRQLICKILILELQLDNQRGSIAEMQKALGMSEELSQANIN